MLLVPAVGLKLTLKTRIATKHPIAIRSESFSTIFGALIPKMRSKMTVSQNLEHSLEVRVSFMTFLRVPDPKNSFFLTEAIIFFKIEGVLTPF